MKTGKYNIRDLFNNRYIEQIIIPEIQRDYVWGEEQVTGLLNSIIDDFGKYRSSELALPDDMDEELKADFLEYYRAKAFASNIGFIYAYTDPEYAGKYFLIDGQQRITTIYLVLLALMSRNGLAAEFRELYQQNSGLKLDYRVRETAHSFIENFVKFVLKNKKDVTDRVWFHREYLHDQTICSVIENFDKITCFLDKINIDEHGLLEYIQEHIEFWYFDTNISEQGEELYIYMNARGEQMQSNENLKADLLGLLHSSEKNRYGELWERWQDIFWQNRRGNENADKGFNEFLKCIAGLENYINNKKNFYTADEFNGKDHGAIKDFSYPDLKAALSFPQIRKYIDGLNYIIENKDRFAANYKYSLWIHKCIESIWDILNDENTNWFADYSDQGRGVERNRMVFLWSILHYLTAAEFLDDDNVFRVLRFFYLRYNNYNRSVTLIKSKIQELIVDGIWGKTIDEDEDSNENDSEQSLNEEQLKNKWFLSLPAEELRGYEAVIWEIEDHPYNIDGSYLFNKNSSHLVNYKKEIGLKKLTYIKDRFYQLFPSKGAKPKILQTVLISYGEFWEVQSPYYYKNFGFNDWRRIVRDVDGDKKTFKAFFKDWINEPEVTLEQRLQDIQPPQNVEIEVMDLHQQLQWYSAHLKTAMWEKGGNIALRDWVKYDKVFRKSPKFYNTRGTMRGNDQNELASLLSKEITRGLKAKSV